MKDRKFHTNKELKDNYPKPGVPSDEAWAEMNKMLGPVPPNLPTAKGLVIKGIRKFIWYITSAITVVIVTVLASHYSNTGKKNTATISTTNNSLNKNDTSNLVIQQDTLTSNGKVENPLDNSIVINDSASQINSSATNTEGKADNKSPGKDQASSLYNDSTNFILKKNTAGDKPLENAPLGDNSTKAMLQKNKTVMKPGNDTGLPGNIHTDSRSKNKSGNKEKNNNHKETTKNAAGKLPVHRDLTTGSHSGNRNRTIIKAQNNNASYKRHNAQGILNDHRHVSISKQLVTEINTPGSSLPARTISFIKEPIGSDSSIDLQVDSSYAKRIKNALQKNTSKKHNTKPGRKEKNAHKKSESGLEYGLQWDVPVPIQGTTNYFTGTNGKSKPYNILVPQLWLSKGLTGKSKIFFKVNANQQYFAGNKKLAADTAAPPLDSTYHTKSLLKTSGYSATLQYSYRIYKNWATSIGLTYIVNRNALLNKQEISRYNGAIVGDTTYGIKRSSADWRYIKNSQLSGNVELYYIFKKFNVGASLYLPLSNIPVYGNKNIHPVNAQFFLRWNIKKE